MLKFKIHVTCTILLLYYKHYKFILPATLKNELSMDLFSLDILQSIFVIISTSNVPSTFCTYTLSFQMEIFSM